MSEPLTTYETDPNGVALLRLDRPQSRNAINTQMLEELLAHLETARADEDLRVLVLSSTDHMGFSAGADVREDLDRDGAIRRMQLFADLYDGLTGFPHPTIAACHGACVGGGAEIAVACDLRVGGSNMRLRFPGAGLGVPVGPARLVTLCGLSVAKYLLLTSKEVAVDEALRWGLVHKVAPAPRTEEVALSSPRRSPITRPSRWRGSSRCCTPGTGSRNARARRASARSTWQSRGPGPRLQVLSSLNVPLALHSSSSPMRDDGLRGARRRGRRSANPVRTPRGAGLRQPAPVPARRARRGRAGPGGRPVLCVAADDRGARDLAAELGAYLAPRRVRYYPSRGTGYESHLAPPPHLVGLRIAALDALVGGRREPSRRSSSRARSPSPRRSPTRRCARPASRSTKGEEVDLTDVAELLVGCGYERVEQVDDRGQFAIRGGILDVFGSTEDQAARIELFGDEIESIRFFSTFTQRSLSEADRIELDPAAEIDPDHRLLAEAALADADEDGAGASPSPSSCRPIASARCWS